MNISKDVWREVFRVLSKYKIPFAAKYENVPLNDSDTSPSHIVNKHIQINLVIQDYFEDSIKDTSNVSD